MLKLVMNVLGAACLASCSMGFATADTAGLKNLQRIDAKSTRAQIQRINWIEPASELAVTFEDETNRLRFWKVVNGTPRLMMDHTFADRQLSGVCLHQSDSDTFAYLFDDKGYLAQWRLDLKKQTMQLVRTLAGSYNSKDCAVPVNSQDLYVLEEGVGLWRFSADAELEDERTLVAAVKPVGKLSADAEELVLNKSGIHVDRKLAVKSKNFRPDTRRVPIVYPVMETQPVSLLGDVIDDPVLWLTQQEAPELRIFATDKRMGLRVYDKAGKEIQRIGVGRINNIDLRELDNHPTFAALATASNRTLHSISVFGIDRAGKATWLKSSEIPTQLDDPYGLCMYQSPEALYVFVNDKDGRYQQWQLSIADDAVSGQLVREFTVDDQPEGCAADDKNRRLFLGVEDQGVYHINADPNLPAKLQTVAEVDGKSLHDDVEGMDLVMIGDSGYLLVSSQGNSTYALFDRLPPYRYRASFKVGADWQTGIDGSGGTDGLAVLTTENGGKGWVAVQDGLNVGNATHNGWLPQNLKLIEWQHIAETLADQLELQQPVAE